MFELLLPKDCIVHTAVPDECLAVELFAEEQALLTARAVDKRRREFAAGRHCAHQGLAKLTGEPAPVTMHDSRAPHWPAGVVGSITHSADYAAAAVADARQIIGIGIDVEQRRPMEAAICQRIAQGEELAWIDQGNDPQLHALLLFSAKESLHKFLQPLTGQHLGFQDACLTALPDMQGFQLRFDGPQGEVVVQGRWGFDADRVYTAIAPTCRQWALATGEAGRPPSP